MWINKNKLEDRQGRWRAARFIQNEGEKVLGTVLVRIQTRQGKTNRSTFDKVCDGEEGRVEGEAALDAGRVVRCSVVAAPHLAKDGGTICVQAIFLVHF